MKAEWTNSDSLTTSQTTKAIVVINDMDIPKNCMSCPLIEYHREYSIVCRHYQTGDTRPSWCPLKPMPEKKAPSVQLSARHNDEHMEILGLRCTDYEKGWNECIEELEK